MRLKKSPVIKMKRILITQGQFAVVDNEDYKWLSQHKWFAQWCEGTQSFYAGRNSKQLKGKKRHLIYMHREILGLKYGDKRQTDHKDHNTLDNRELNLRIVNHRQNQWNRKNTKGYCWNKPAKKYQAYIRVNSKQISLGYFYTTKKAHNAYLRAKEKYHVTSY